jgi:hypothetical protein
VDKSTHLVDTFFKLVRSGSTIQSRTLMIDITALTQARWMSDVLLSGCIVSVLPQQDK